MFDKGTGRSIGFEKCLRLSGEHLGLSPEQLGLLRALDALRDDEQHWLASLNEGLLYLHARGAITLFDEVLSGAFGERLADHLPTRVLPISTRPMTDMDVLVDEQYGQITDLLQPGKRRRPEARALLRGLLAMEGHVSEEALVSERDVDRVERAARDGEPLEQVFPRLRDVTATFDGDGPTVRVHFTKHEVRAPLRAGGRPHRDGRRPRGRSAAEVPPRARRARGAARPDGAEGGRAATASPHRRRRRLRPRLHLGSQRRPRYSDNAVRRMQEALEDVDMDEVWRVHGPRRRRRVAT